MLTANTSTRLLKAFALFALLAFGLVQLTSTSDRTFEAFAGRIDVEASGRVVLKAPARIADALARPEPGNRAVTIRAELQPKHAPGNGVVLTLPTIVVPTFLAQATNYVACSASIVASESAACHLSRAPPRI